MAEGGAPTSYDVARRAGVSQATVSMVLNGTRGSIRVSEATKQRVLDVARGLGYVPNHAARSLSSRRTNILTVITYGLDNPYFVGIVLGVQRAAHARGYAVNIVSVTSPQEESILLRHLAGGSSDGIIDASGYDPATQAALHELADHRIPTVAAAWHRSSPDPTIPTIRIDFARGGYLATKHLVDLGHRRIAHVTQSGSEMHRSADNAVGARLAGYRRALDEADIPFDESLIVPAPNSPAGGGEAADALMARERRRRPTAIFYFNDYMAIGGLHALWRAGVAVPDEVAVVGFDGIADGVLTTPELTTVEVHRADLGGRAVDLLLRMIDGKPLPKRRPTIPLDLVVRDSCGARAAQSRRGRV